MTYKVVIAGGGTGGHLFPGIALAEEFITRKEGWNIIFIGTERGLGKKIIPKWGYEHKIIPSAPLKGRSWGAKTIGLITFLRGMLRSIVLLREISPQLVIGLGGYSSGPVLLAAYVLRIKRVIQEQNVLPGFTNRMASKFSQRIFLSWPEETNSFPREKVRVTGNPLRKGVLEGRGTKREAKGFTLLILGGSQGANTINKVMIEALKSLDLLKKDLKVIHQTGEGDHLWVTEEYKKKGFKASVHSFIEDMAACYRDAHFVICRAGASTIAEICAWGRASLLIPYPFAADDHQRKNALLLVNKGAGRMIPEETLTGDTMAQEIRSIYQDRRKLEEMEMQAASLGQPDAATLIVDDCYRLLGLR